MTHPAERRLNRIATDSDYLRRRTPDVLTALATLAATGYPAGRGDGRGGSHSTSVEAAVTHHARQAAEQLDAMTAALAGQITELVEHVKTLPTTRMTGLKCSTAVEAQRARCTGGEGEWADPHCANLEVRPNHKSDLVRGVTFGLCWTCITRRRRWLERQDQQAG